MNNLDDQFWLAFAHVTEQLNRLETANEVTTTPSPTAVDCTELAEFYPRNEPAIPLPAMAGSTPDVQTLRRPQLDSPSPPQNTAKPWKKPWDP